MPNCDRFRCHFAKDQPDRLGLVIRCIFSEFYLPGTEPSGKKDVCNNALNIHIVASIIANICSWILQRNDL